MATATAARPSIDRPIPLRQRPDLVVAAQWFGRRYFVVKDPLTLAYAYLTEQEHYILSALDGQTNVAELQDRFNARFAPQQIGASQLHAYLGSLHRSGLVLGLAPGQGEQLAERHLLKHRFEPLKRVEQLLAFRWRGINAEPLLAWLTPRLGGFFSVPGFVAWLGAIFLAAVVITSRWDELIQRMTDGRLWMTSAAFVWLGVSLAAVKTLHELGHAIAARRFGCRCNEIGIQIFFLLPCLYTNVSDVWLIKDKWRRIAVSAAGIYVELLLAAVAALVWSIAQPGAVATICQSVLLVASVGTLLLNGNPLMRYDGYYVLADLVEVPNLEQRSRSQLVSYIARWCTGIDWQPAEELDRRPQPLLAAYAAAALAYRATVLIGVYLASRAMLTPWRLGPLSDALAAGAGLAIIIPLATTFRQFWMHAQRSNSLKISRLAVTLAALALAAALVFMVPLPMHSTAVAQIEAQDALPIYATVAGTLEHSLPAGSEVKQGQTIAQLQSPELQRDLARLAAEQKQQALRLVELETLRGDSPERAAQIPAVRQSLADLSDRTNQLRELVARLTIAAPCDGIVLSPPRRDRDRSARQLAGWSGTPLDTENLGGYLETGTLICLVGQRGKLEAMAVVDQSDAALIAPGRAATLSIAQWPFGPIRGTVNEVARVDIETLPLHLAAAGNLPQKTDSAGRSQPLATSYQIRIRLDNPPDGVLPGATARIRINAAPQTIAARIARAFSRTFRF